MDEKVREIMFSSEFTDWETPDDLFQKLNEEFKFTTDVCASLENSKCKAYINPKQNMLVSSWNGTAWMNPPYNKPEKPCKDICSKKKCVTRGFHRKEYLPGQIDFVDRARSMALRNQATTVCLLPVRTDTELWHKYIWDEEKNSLRDYVSVRFIKGRLKFKQAKDPAPFPSMIVIFHKVPDVL